MVKRVVQNLELIDTAWLGNRVDDMALPHVVGCGAAPMVVVAMNVERGSWKIASCHDDVRHHHLHQFDSPTRRVDDVGLDPEAGGRRSGVLVGMVGIRDDFANRRNRLPTPPIALKKPGFYNNVG